MLNSATRREISQLEDKTSNAARGQEGILFWVGNPGPSGMEPAPQLCDWARWFSRSAARDATCKAQRIRNLR